MKKNVKTLRTRLTALLLALVCVLGLFPATALAAEEAGTIMLEKFGASEVSYVSDSLGRCTLHQMFFGHDGRTTIGFCAEKGKGMGWSLNGQAWGDPQPYTDPTVETMMAYYYAHSTGVFTDQAKALGEDQVWDSDYSWYMNAWVQAIIWRQQAGTLGDPAVGCAEELMCVWNSLEGASYTSIDDVHDGVSFRDKARYILDLGARGVWGTCSVYEYTFTGAGSTAHPAGTVQKVLLGELAVGGTEERYSLTIKKVDATNPNKGLPGARFQVASENGSYSKEVVTGSDGTVTLSPLDAGTYAVTELEAPEGYEIDNAGPQYAVLPNSGDTSATVIFTDTPVITGKGTIRKVDADDPTKGLAGAVIKITGVDNDFVGTYTSGTGGYLTDIPWDTMPLGSYIAEEVTPPTGYTKSNDQSKVKQPFEWDGKSDISLIFENDAKVKVKLLKLDDSDHPLPGCVFNIVKDGQIIGTEETGVDGTITVTNVTEGMYAFVEVSAPAPYATLTEPVIAHVDQATINGGGTVTVAAANKKLPLLTIRKVDAADSATPIPNTVFTIKGVNSDYQHDVTTGADGTASLRVAPGSYQITEKSVPAPYFLPDKDADRVQTISLNAGDEKTVVFKDHKAPELTVYKEDSVAGAPIEGAKFRVTYTSNGEAADAPATIDFGEILTDANGQIKLHEQGKRLYPGEYTVTEVAPAPGFQMKEPTTQKIIIRGGESKTLTFLNEPLNGIVVEKYDSVTHEALPGCTFQLRFLGGTSGTGGTVIGTKVTGKNGTAIWTGLQSGTYVVEEIDPADGYSIINSSETVFISDNGKQEVITVSFDNAPDGILLIRKVCSVNPGITLQDAEFKIMYADGTLIGDSNSIFKTDENGEIRIPGLKPGKSVVVTETRAPDGFLIDTQSQTVQIKEGRTVSLTFKNQPRGKLIIQKRDSITGQPLPGAQFRVTTAAGCEVGLDGVIGTATLTSNGIFTTDSNGEIRVSNLAPGALVITEVKAPAGYVMDSPSTNVVIGPNGDTQTVVITNTPKGSLIVEKYDSVTKQPLAGAQFRITTASGELVPDNEGLTSSNGLYTTNAEGQIVLSKLLPNTYVVTETKAPGNYRQDPNSQTVVVNAWDTQTIRFYNDPLCTLTILKRDAVTRKPLKGAEFTVKDSDGRDVGRYVTGTDGTATVTGLEPNATYVVSESKAPTGYIKDETPKNIVVRTGVANTLIFDDEPVTTLIIRKFIEGTENEPLSGVAFKVVDGAGAAVGPDDGTYYTDKAGEIVLDGIEPGTTVTAREIKTVEGYVLDGTPQDILIKAGEVQQLTFWNKKAGTLVIQKKDKMSGEMIPGAQFQLTYANGGYVDNANGHLSSNGLYTTDDKGEIRISGITGTVVVKETKPAPGYVIDQSTQTQTVTVNPEDTQTLVFLNEPLCSLTLKKVDATNGKPIPGTVFLVKDGNGGLIGQYTTGKDGTVTVTGLVPGSTVVVTEYKVPSGYVLDPTPQTIIVKNGSNTVSSGAGGSQAAGTGSGTGGGNQLDFENDPIGGVELIKVNETDKSQRIPNTTFEIRKMDGGLVDTVTTGSDGRVTLDLDAGDYCAVEIEAAQGFKLDATPHYFTVEDGKPTTVTVTNRAFSGVIIHKVNSVTGDGIYDVKFLVYDQDRNPIGEYATDNEGYIYIDDLTVQGKGRLYIRELEAAPGYELDKEYKTVYVQPGKTVEVEWENTPITGQIQVMKYAAEYNEVTGTPAGTPLQGAVYEISDPRSNKVVDYITTDARGIAASKPLPLGRYKIKEVTAPAYWQLSGTVFDETLEYSGQIIKVSDYDRPSDLGVSITKRGNAEVLSGSQMRYDFTMANTSNVPLDNYYWHDRIPTDAARATVLTTGTYCARLNYRVLYKTNYSANYQVLASNLLTSNNYSFSLNAIPMQAGEVVTDVYFDFGKVPVGFQSVAKPTLTVQVLTTAANGYQLVNRADTGGKYQGIWQTANASWVTIIRKLTVTPPPTLPKTGY